MAKKLSKYDTSKRSNLTQFLPIQHNKLKNGIKML